MEEYILVNYAAVDADDEGVEQVLVLMSVVVYLESDECNKLAGSNTLGYLACNVVVEVEVEVVLSFDVEDVVTMVMVDQLAAVYELGVVDELVPGSVDL